ncbi:MAG: glutaredoxin family protein [Nostocoides sp.]
MTEHDDQPAVLRAAFARARVVLLGRDGCHLCVAAAAIIERVSATAGSTWCELDVDSDPDLRARYSDEVPVTFVDGVQHDYWRVDEARLAAALKHA